MEFLAQFNINTTPLTLIHILGVAFGLGIATGMDFLLARMVFSHSTLTKSHYQTLDILSKFVSLALVMLWISGLGFLAYYNTFSPDKLLNPKIWSKLSIVTILTINGLVIHYKVLPKLKNCINHTLITALPYKTLAVFFTTGAVSAMSWYIPFIYGTVPQLNFAFSFVEFSVAYGMILSTAILVGLTMLGFLHARAEPKHSDIQQPEPDWAKRHRLLVRKRESSLKEGVTDIG